MKIILMLLLALISLSGCTATKEPIKLYQGSDRGKDSIVTLQPPQKIFMVLYVSGKVAGGSCLTNCMFLSPVNILPGKNTFSSTNMNVPPFDEKQILQPLPPDLKNIFPLRRTGSSLFANNYSFEFEQTLEKGETYVLRIGYTKGDDEKGKYYVWWQSEQPK